jgi:hypothetical protein
MRARIPGLPFVGATMGNIAYACSAFGSGRMRVGIQRRLENISGFQWCLIIWLLLSLGFLAAGSEGLWWRI